MAYTYELEWLKTNLTNERYEHSIGTAECAKELAQRFGQDAEKAFYAGLVHDCAKCLSKDESLNILNTMQKDLVDGEMENIKTWHAPCGVFIAKNEFGVIDEDILSAIRWHTLGNLNMTDFEKIIFLADKIENKTRPKNVIQPIKNSLKNGLDSALFVCYKNTIKSLADRNLKICPLTIDIYNKLSLRNN